MDESQVDLLSLKSNKPCCFRLCIHPRISTVPIKRLRGLDPTVIIVGELARGDRPGSWASLTVAVTMPSSTVYVLGPRNLLYPAALRSIMPRLEASIPRYFFHLRD